MWRGDGAAGGVALELLQDISDFSSALKAKKRAANQLRSHVASSSDGAHDADQLADLAGLEVAKLHVGVNSFEGQLKKFVLAHIIEEKIRLYRLDKCPQRGNEKVLEHVELLLDLLRQPAVELLEVCPINLRTSRHNKSPSSSAQPIGQAESNNSKQRAITSSKSVPLWVILMILTR